MGLKSSGYIQLKGIKRFRLSQNMIIFAEDLHCSHNLNPYFIISTFLFFIYVASENLHFKSINKLRRGGINLLILEYHVSFPTIEFNIILTFTFQIKA